MARVNISASVVEGPPAINLFDSDAEDSIVHISPEYSLGTIRTISPSKDVGFSILRQGKQTSSFIMRSSTPGWNVLALYYELTKVPAPVWLEGRARTKLLSHSGVYYMLSPSAVLEHEAPAGPKRETVVIHIGVGLLRGLLEEGTFAKAGKAAAFLLETSGEPILGGGMMQKECYTILAALRNCPYVGMPRRLWLEAKAMELAAIALSDGAAANGPAEPVSPRDAKKMDDARQFIESRLREGASLAQVAFAAGVSVSKLKRDFKRCFGISVHQFVVEKRMLSLSALMSERDLGLKEAAYYAGYSSIGHFLQTYERRFGAFPRHQRGNRPALE
jgi:AraC family transcriptional activator of pyochelin receptor